MEIERYQPFPCEWKYLEIGKSRVTDNMDEKYG